MTQSPRVGDTVTVIRGERPVRIHVPTPEQLNDAVLDAATAIGTLRGLADGLAERNDVGFMAPAIYETADRLERFVALVEPEYRGTD